MQLQSTFVTLQLCVGKLYSFIVHYVHNCSASSHRTWNALMTDKQDMLQHMWDISACEACAV